MPAKDLALGFRCTSKISFRELTMSKLAEGRGVATGTLEVDFPDIGLSMENRLG